MRPGTLVGGRFHVERLAGSGGMGAVYAARDDVTGETVALKVLTARGADATGRFLREGALLAQVAHPAVVRYVAHGTSDAGELYLAMEWLEGEDLADRLDRQPLTMAESVALAARIARALAALHAREIVHRDVKPSNVFLVGGKVPGAKLLDLGIARSMPGRGRVTRTGAVVGTPGYMPPEQLRGERELGATADVFALGCVLFECLTGRSPFVGEHPIALLARILLEPPPAPSTLAPGLPRALDELVLAMLARDPEDRPHGGEVVAAALEAMQGLPADAPASSTLPSLRALTTSEQRMVSVVLGGAPARPETFASDHAEDIERRLDEIAAMPGARLEALLDGSILVAFAGEAAATDRAVKAARAALRLREILPGLPLAVATGRVVVSAGNTSSFSIGEAVDRAARALVSPRAVAIDVTTAQLLDDRFEIRGEGEHLELAGERSAGDATRTVLGKRTPCVGREREIGVLEAVLAECAADSVARAALVVGPPGIGKSRIRHELIRRLALRGDAVRVWLARADPVGKGSPLALVAQLVRQAGGILDGEPTLLRQAKLAAAVAGRVEPGERGRVTELLAELIGAPFPGEGRLRAARRDPISLGDEMRRAFEDLLAAECAAGPLLLVLEDLHFGDRSTVLWLDGALRNLADRPLMVLALARPEVQELFPKLWRERSLTEIHVGELSRRAGARLAREVLDPGADEETIARLVERSGGNAFYLEELLRAAAAGAVASLPETVLAMVHARIAAIEPEGRRVLRAASVFGEVFWRSGVTALLGGGAAGEPAEWLTVLVERELVLRRGQGRLAGEEEYAFRHALVRDAAYSMLTDEDRRMGHRAAGVWLEKAGEQDAMALAEHLEIGGAMPRALVQIRRAAEQALEGSDFDAVLARVERGVSAGAEGAIHAGLLTLAAEARMWRSEFEEASRAARLAMAKVPREHPSWCRAASQLAFACTRLALVEPAKALAAELRAAAPAAPARDDYVTAMSRIGSLLFQAGELELARELYEELGRLEESAELGPRAMGALHTLRATALVRTGGSLEESLRCMLLAAESFTEAGDLRRAWVSRSNAGCAATELGQLELAEEYLRGALSHAERMGLSVTMTVRENLAKLLVKAHRSEEAEAMLLAQIGASAARGYPRGEGVCQGYLAELLLDRGELERAGAAAERAAEVLASMPALEARPLAILARVRLAEGRPADGLAVAIRADEARRSGGGELEEGDALVRLALAEALFATGRLEEARAAIEAAEARLLDRAAKIADPERRASFLGRVSENGRTIALARAWRA